MMTTMIKMTDDNNDHDNNDDNDDNNDSADNDDNCDGNENGDNDDNHGKSYWVMTCFQLIKEGNYLEVIKVISW